MDAISFIKSKLDGKPYTDIGDNIRLVMPSYDSIAHAEPELYKWITLYAAFEKSKLIEIPTAGVEYEDEETIVVNQEYFDSEEFFISDNNNITNCLYYDWR